MAFPNVTLVYSVRQGGAPIARLQAAMAGVPLPLAVLSSLGMRVVGDVTTPVGQSVGRVIHLNAEPIAPAAATAHVDPMLQGSPITKVTVTSSGSGYILPPVVIFPDPASLTLAQWLAGPVTEVDPQTVPGIHLQQGRGAHAQAYLKLDEGTSLLTGGTLYSAGTTVAFVGGMPYGNLRQSPDPELLGADPPAGMGPLSTRTKDAPAGGLCVGSVGMLAPGLNYSSSTTVAFLGTQAPGGTPATGAPIFGKKGRIAGVLVTSPGSKYIVAPQVIFSDPINPHPDAPITPPQDTLQDTRNQAPFLARATASMVRGTPATGHLTIGGGGVVTGFTLDTAGDGYVTVPDVVIFDPLGTGSGASLAVLMNLSRIDMLNGGSRYIAPGVILLPAYEANFMPGFAAGVTAPAFLPFVNLMASAIAAATASPVSVSLPA